MKSSIEVSSTVDNPLYNDWLAKGEKDYIRTVKVILSGDAELVNQIIETLGQMYTLG